MSILTTQKEFLLGGKSNIVKDKNLFNAAMAFVKAAGHKNGDQFYSDPEERDAQGNISGAHPIAPATSVSQSSGAIVGPGRNADAFRPASALKASSRRSIASFIAAVLPQNFAQYLAHGSTAYSA